MAKKRLDKDTLEIQSTRIITRHNLALEIRHLETRVLIATDRMKEINADLEMLDDGEK